MRRLAPLLFATTLALLFTIGPAAQAATPQPTALPLDKNGGPLARVGDLAVIHDEWEAQAARPGASAAAFEPNNKLAKVADGLVLIDAAAEADSAALLRDLQALGLERGAASGWLVSGWLPLDAIDEAAALGSLRFARPAYSAGSVGLTTSQGDRALRSNLLRSASGLTGRGLTVGVLSDSYNCLGGAANDVASGDLPAGVQVLAESRTCSGSEPDSDEGRGMLQLVHDVAPGAALSFYTANEGQAAFAQGIDRLADAGADVIVDDIIYLAEPMFQDGPVAQAADAVRARGVPFFSAAGNNGRDSYESSFRAGTTRTIDGQNFLLHDFDPGAATDSLQRLTIAPGGSLQLVLQWDDRFRSVSGLPGAATDVDAYLFDSSGTQVLARGDNASTGNDPVEVVQLENTSGSSLEVNLAIGRFIGPNPGRLKYVLFGSGVQIAEYATDSGTSYGHSNAAGAIAVGATAYQQTPAFGVSPARLRSFSSAGGVPILFNTNGTRKATPEVRQRPQLVGPDGANTSFFPADRPSDSDGDGFPNFSGTSAAAPHVAAVAALLLEAQPLLTPAAIERALTSSAGDMGTPGFDFDSGYGFVQADSALASLASNLALGGSASPVSVTAGTVLSYTLVITNVGSTSVASATLRTAFSGEVELVTATVGTRSCVDGRLSTVESLTCPLGTLAGGSTASVALVVRPLTLGTLRAELAATNSFGAANPTSGTIVLSTTVTTPSTVADLGLVATGSPTTIIGDVVSYTLTISNSGPQVAQQITATLLLTSEVEGLVASGSGWSCGASMGLVTCTRPTAPTGTLPRITVRATATQAGPLRAVGEARSATWDPLRTNNRTAFETEIIFPPQAALPVVIH